MRAIRWFGHWFFQGLKAMLFVLSAAMVAAVVASPIQFLVALAVDREADYAHNPVWLELSIALGNFLSVFVGLAIFAFVLASQLKSHPFREPESLDEAVMKEELPENEGS